MKKPLPNCILMAIVFSVAMVSCKPLEQYVPVLVNESSYTILVYDDGSFYLLEPGETKTPEGTSVYLYCDCASCRARSYWLKCEVPITVKDINHDTGEWLTS